MIFTLVVDDFVIKFHNKCHAEHLFKALCTKYEISVYWTGNHYCRSTIDWNYDKAYVDISMPDYVQEALQYFQHPSPTKPEHAAHSWTTPDYGSKVQYSLPSSTLPILDKKGIKSIKSISGTFLYYTRSIDACILPALNEISASQAQPTEDTNKKYTMLMYYAHTYPDAVIRYHASNMRLHIDSDAEPTLSCPTQEAVG